MEIHGVVGSNIEAMPPRMNVDLVDLLTPGLLNSGDNYFSPVLSLGGVSYLYKKGLFIWGCHFY